MKPLADLVLRDVPRRYPKMSAAVTKAEKMRCHWADPEYRARIGAAMRRAWQLAPKSSRSDDSTLADLRRQGLTLEQIGSRVGLTRERVRQRLKRCGDPSLIGLAAPCHAKRKAQTIERWTQICEACGGSFVRAIHRRFCSSRCWGTAQSAKGSPKVEKMIEARRQGMTWAESWIAAGYKKSTGNMAAMARATATRYAKRHDLNIDDVSGLSPNGRHNIRERTRRAAAKRKALT